MIQDFGYFQKKIDVDLFPAEDIVHIGAIAMQQFGKSGNTDILLLKYFPDSFSNTNFFWFFLHYFVAIKNVGLNRYLFFEVLATYAPK